MSALIIETKVNQPEAHSFIHDKVNSVPPNGVASNFQAYTSCGGNTWEDSFIVHLAARITVPIFICSVAFSAITTFNDHFRNRVPQTSRALDLTIIQLCYASALLALLSTLITAMSLLTLIWRLDCRGGSPMIPPDNLKQSINGKSLDIVNILSDLLFLSPPSTLCGAITLFIWDEFENGPAKWIIFVTVVICALLWIYRALLLLLLFIRRKTSLHRFIRLLLFLPQPKKFDGSITTQVQGM